MTEEQHEMTDLLTQDGHLSELTLNRLVAGEFGTAEEEFLRDHVDDCDACSARLDAVQDFDTGFAIGPPAGLRPTDEDADDESDDAVVHDLGHERDRRGLSVGMVGLALAAAAAIFVAINLGPRNPAPDVVPGEVDDGIRVKGSGLSVGVFAKPESGPARAVSTGDVVYAGERLGFQLTSRKDGHVMIVGVDDRGTVYPVFPQSSPDAQLAAVFVRGDSAAKDLESAIRLDAAGRSERIVVARCPEPFTMREFTSYVTEGREIARTKAGGPGEDRLRGCVYDEVTLDKRTKK